MIQMIQVKRRKGGNRADEGTGERSTPTHLDHLDHAATPPADTGKAIQVGGGDLDHDLDRHLDRAPLAFLVPVKTASTINVREHHMARHRRNVAHADAVAWTAPKRLPAPLLEVRLTRLGVQQLDDDNLRSSLKAVRDAVAKWLRVDDATTLVRWTYAQAPVAPGEEAVRVEVESVRGGLDTVPAWERVQAAPRPRAPRSPAASRPGRKETPAERLRRLATSASYGGRK